MQRLRHGAALLVFGLTIVAHPLAAQSSARTDLLDVLMTADDDGEFLRVTTGDGRSVEGYIRDLDDSVVRLGGGAVELELVEQVEVRRMEGRKSTTGIVVGAIAGGVVFGSLALFAAGICENCDATVPVAITVAGVTLGSMVGGLTGAALAPGEEEWTVRWSR